MKCNKLTTVMIVSSFLVGAVYLTVVGQPPGAPGGLQIGETVHPEEKVYKGTFRTGWGKSMYEGEGIPLPGKEKEGADKPPKGTKVNDKPVSKIYKFDIDDLGTKIGGWFGGLRRAARPPEPVIYTPEAQEVIRYREPRVYVEEKVTPIRTVTTVTKRKPLRREAEEEVVVQEAPDEYRTVYVTDDCFIDKRGRLICPAGAYVVKD